MSTPPVPRHDAGNPAHLLPMEPRRTREAAQDLDMGLDYHELLESVWHSSLDAMRITDYEGLIVAANEAYCRLFEMSMLELLGRPFTVGYGELSRPSHIFADYYRNFREKKVEPSMETHLRLVNGKELYVGISNSFIKGVGGASFVLSVLRDTTERHLAEQAIQNSERKYHELFDNALQGMFQSTIEGRILSANAALLKLLGYESLEELASLAIADEIYVNPMDRQAILREMEDHGVCSNHELRLRRKDGSIITVLEHSRAAQDSTGRMLWIEGILEDITERKALEFRVQEYVAALQKSLESLAGLNSQKDRLFSILSHDLRSPFASILGTCNILLTETDPPSAEEQRQFISNINDAAKRQLALLNRLLDWSRLETGRINLDVRTVDLASIAAFSVKTHLGTAKEKGITLRSSIPEGTLMRADEEMLMQVFNNLISNALKFTPAGGTISIGLADQTPLEWVVNVSDTGKGIPAQDIGKLFRIEEKYTRKGIDGESGTGLGLSLVAEILKKHNGTITVESEVDEGTTFQIRFPRFAESVQQTILVVDDEAVARTLHARFLERIFPNASVIAVPSGLDGLEVARKNPPRLIVTDYFMPEMNGREFLNSLREDPGTRNTPVFVVTGAESRIDTETMLLNGAAAVMEKPVTLAVLQNTIEKVMSERV
jgi:PAS domain S-box-containing protein